MLIAQEGHRLLKLMVINRDKENAFTILQPIREDKTPTQKQVIFLSTFINSRRWCQSELSDIPRGRADHKACLELKHDLAKQRQ